MSAESNDRTKFNEQVVDDLVKEFRDSQFIVEPSEITDNDKEHEVNKEPDECGNTESDTEQEPNTSENKDKEGEEDSDLEELEKQEKELSEDEKKRRRDEASELKSRGNDEFKSEKYTESLETYTSGLRICPLKYSEDRAILYSNRAACKIKLGDNQGAINDCTKAIKLNDRYVRAYLRRAKLYEDTDKLDESLEDYKKIAELDPGNRDAIIAQQRLPPKINERNEKLKTEMLGKLKDLGNMFLRPFGLSTENFKLQQDPNSGGYSINFQQNPPSQ